MYVEGQCGEGSQNKESTNDLIRLGEVSLDYVQLYVAMCRDRMVKGHTTKNLQMIYRPQHMSYICVSLNDLLSLPSADMQVK